MGNANPAFVWMLDRTRRGIGCLEPLRDIMPIIEFLLQGAARELEVGGMPSKAEGKQETEAETTAAQQP